MSCRPTAIAAALSLMACTSAPPPAADQSPAPQATTDGRPGGGAAAANLVPVGYGTLRQDDISARLLLQGVAVRALPLDESVIRVLSPDSYRTLRDLQESRRAEIAALARRHGVQRFSAWYVSFFGVQPQGRFSPQELTITSTGRDFRAVEILPLSSGFGAQRLDQRETQSAIYLFDGGIDVNQPLVVSMEGARFAEWSNVVGLIERERALVRSRAARR